MYACKSVAEEIKTLRARANLYRRLADTFFDRRTATEVVGYACEMEAEAAALEAEAGIGSNAVPEGFRNWLSSTRERPSWRAAN